MCALRMLCARMLVVFFNLTLYKKNKQASKLRLLRIIAIFKTIIIQMLSI